MNTLLIEFVHPISLVPSRAVVIAQDLADAADLLQLHPDAVTIVSTAPAGSVEDRSIVSVQEKGGAGTLFPKA